MQLTLSNSLAYRAALNSCWAELILEELVRQGVQHVCIAPGSRSTPLTLAAAKQPKLTIHTHFDERGLGFLAIGLAKASQTPVAVIVTSGTAVANLLPAVAESGLTKEKLVLLTSDRPVELLQCGANQAIRQHGIFSQHVTEFVDLPAPTLDISPNWLLGVVDELMHQQQLRGGAIHLNCHYPEPLYGEVVDFSAYLAPVKKWQATELPYCQHQQATSSDIVIDSVQWQRLCDKKGVIVAGKLAPNELADVKALAARLGWPLLVDPQAGGSSEYAGFDGWLQNPACAEVLSQAQVLLQFSARIVSKRLLQFIGDQPWDDYWLIDPQQGRLDPHNHSGSRIQANVSAWTCAALLDEKTSPHSGWALPLVGASKRYREIAKQQCDDLSEMSLATLLRDWLAPDSELFLGNSMIVRLLDMFGDLPTTATFTNRGASGIDGLIATAAGVQRARKAPLVMLLGDTSFLYDLNSLALLKQTALPMVVVVTNNDGGGIFDMLPVPEQQKDDFYRMPHGFEFSHAAAMFELNYQSPTTVAEAQTAVVNAQQVNQTTIIEIKTPAGEAGQMLKEIFSEVKRASLL
ncbi:2-succinyl-5-enolpyruvyl-6-hydroxy-3-cyclohexene-1-carboxylic-acid synthase [Photobacterium angustum]|uniref:2-succinyl-5-enolpyruvyl-6-hydroxy-3-cyclohexene-1-carboxylate synthase n=1 Tax=Photobacterium angustum TaxID=661 RepID=A0A2S7VW20_PHOAN|nr:2-succinyl-5-enolpyruvyl-6-hydroxy-3-cyclohexene-1-carboxylic-acid synthase [Photobacterium angustum]PQJ66310.1 2-succinyl-5-enolpyruvyl-6-hydroxy-3-cyclohexene-1-carboxylic-acid synthase [Photobacterium angustum]